MRTFLFGLMICLPAALVIALLPGTSPAQQAAPTWRYGANGTIVPSSSRQATLTGVNFKAITVTGPATYTVLSSDVFITCNVYSGNVTINLPSATGSGRAITVKNYATVNGHTCGLAPVGGRGGGDTIEGLGGGVTLSLVNAFQTVTLVDAQGATWFRQQNVTIGSSGDLVTADGKGGFGASMTPPIGNKLLDHLGLQSPVTLQANTPIDLYQTTGAFPTGLPAGACAQLTVVFQHNSGTHSLLGRLDFAGQNVVLSGSSTSASVLRDVFRICNRAGVQNAQDVYVLHGDGAMFSQTNMAKAATSLDLSGTFVLSFAIDPGVNADDQVTLISGETEIIK